MLPGVINALKDCGHLDEYVLFNRLINQKRFPMDNIAFVLFLDVVRWYGLDRSTFMRYSDTVKLFWQTGLRLFHGRFLRFMGGPNMLVKSLLQTHTLGTLLPSKRRSIL